MTDLPSPANLDRQWPNDGLEVLGHCPVCGSKTRTVMHSGLSDRIFFSADGEGTMWRCTQCRSSYLDPRPNRETIGLAYASYYTHELPEVAAYGPITRLRQALGNDYRNSRYHSRKTPSLPLIGRLAVAISPKVRHRIDSEYRFLPRYGPGARLLDVGCGNGQYLRSIGDTGWKLAGVEPDDAARTVARNEGFEVRATLDDWQDRPGSFDFVTASHVIEHVHDHQWVLTQIGDLLVPGGKLYLQTPSINAPSHVRFGSHWRGLEPPRHLVIFNRNSLTKLLAETGFEIEKSIASIGAAEFLIEQSLRIGQGRDPYTGEQRSAPPPPSAPLADAQGAEDDEFITLIAAKA